MAIERFPVEASHIMMFARSVGDPNPAFSDPDSPEAKAAGGILAPPTFAMAGNQFNPDLLVPRLGEPWFGSGREPSGAKLEGAGGLHAEQIFEYHKPMRPGMVLTSTKVEGKTWEKESRRGGRLVFSETITEFREKDTGEAVVTMRSVGVKPEHPISEGN